MTAKEKIEQLRDAWYGMDVFAAVVGLLLNGIGILNIGGAAIGLCISLAVTWFIGKKLLARSSLMRMFLVVVSGILMVLGTLGMLKVGALFLGTWSLKYLLTMVLGVAGLYMHLRSFRVLRDKTVRAYFG